MYSNLDKLYTNDKSGHLNSFTFYYNYNDEQDSESGFKLYVKPDYKGSAIIVITPVGIINPRQKVEEVYNSILNTMMFVNVNLNECKIYIDFLEITGPDVSHLYEWKFTIDRGKLCDELISIKDIGEDNEIELFKSLDDMYSFGWSFLSNSLLNNKQKIQLVAYTLTNKYIDDVSIEHIVSNFKMYLKKKNKNENILKDNIINKIYK